MLLQNASNTNTSLNINVQLKHVAILKCLKLFNLFIFHITYYIQIQIVDFPLNFLAR